MSNSEVVVVTGASAGIGRATARAFAKRGARVALLARGRDGLEAARDEVVASGGRALLVPVDVADSRQVEEAADRVEREFGPIDVWVNNAMVTIFSPLREITPEEFKRATETTYLGTVYGTMAALKRMLPRNRGSIVQVGSALAYRALPLQAAYCGAKFAIRGFTDSLRSELIHEGSKVHVTMVQLSAFNTPQFDWARVHLERRPQPVPPIFQPEVAAEAIVWAAHHRRRELWVGFPAVKTILGNKLIPGVIDRLLASIGYSGQQTREALDPDRPDNLFVPVPGDHGAHGRFDERARERSWQVLATTHRHWVVLGGIVALGAIAGILSSRSRRSAGSPFRLYRTSRSSWWPRHRRSRW